MEVFEALKKCFTQDELSSELSLEKVHDPRFFSACNIVVSKLRHPCPFQLLKFSPWRIFSLMCFCVLLRMCCGRKAEVR
jgi:hypothetical protein